MNKLILEIAKKAIVWGATYYYNYVDTDNDGKISKGEIKSQVVAPLFKLIEKINKKRNK